MHLNGVAIEDTFAEAFTMYGARVTITAVNEKWANHAALAATGFATSIIGCGIEAGIEGPALSSPDSRPGVNCLFFTTSKEDMEKQLLNRIGQAIMTAPTTACYDGLAQDYGLQEQPTGKLKLGSKLRFFGDGYQSSKVISGRRFWRIPVMEGEFLVQEEFTVVKGVGGGNFLILAETAAAALAAAEAAVEAIRAVRGVILPFPGGVVRSGSQVGSRYKFLKASTNVAFCPTLRGIAARTMLPPGVNSVLEIVIDGLTPETVAEAMGVGIRAACLKGVRAISAGNYGGRLGKHLFPLRQIVQ
ncbi:MAG: formylmethanofuran--tetrahydromethanopterin N-formyltransferase [Moorella sp. (in: firmicutes)]|jgi:formylmethanofuran--tetrahydromethanopterin N-formyltransferase|nr:formylmethanofuran--tetrahydromethanopterin N-formyltransferase [Moorella sp. (in: firmicutes)]